MSLPSFPHLKVFQLMCLDENQKIALKINSEIMTRLNSCKMLSEYHWVWQIKGSTDIKVQTVGYVTYGYNFAFNVSYSLVISVLKV